MPTVREDIEPRAVFPAPKGKTAVKRITVFPAEHWEKWGGKPGQFRIMLGESWVCRKDERVSFFTVDGVRAFGGDWMLKALGIPVKRAVAPVMEKGTKVLVRSQLPREPGLHWIKSGTRTRPFIDDHGEWRVWIYFRPRPVLVAALEPLEDGSGYRLIEAEAEP